MVELVRTEGVPAYVRIRETLRGRIAQGSLKRGDRLPSEDVLASGFGVSRMTVRKSLEELIDEGILYRRHGVGTFVALPHLDRDHTRLTGAMDKLEGEGIQARTSLLALEVIPARQRVAKALDSAQGDPVIRIKTLRVVNNIPVTLHDAHIPHKLFARILEEDFEASDLWGLFEKRGYRVKRAIEHIEAKEATKDLARLMETEAGAPILYKERTVYADDGTPVEFTYCFNRGDVYSLTVALER
jgi:GntR family transcriptional regulator